MREFIDRLNSFCAEYGYESYKLEGQGITFYDTKGEPFDPSEYRQGSPIRTAWEELETILESRYFR